MQEPYVIVTRGFRNSREGDQITGFQLDLRIPYYRGTFLSLIHYLSLSVDGETIPPERIKIGVKGLQFTMAEMKEADHVRWGFRDTATLYVDKPGGLVPGLHEIETGIVIRKSYMPAEDPEHLYDFFGLWNDGVYHTFIEDPMIITKRMTLVQ